MFTIPTNQKLQMLISYARKGLALKLRISKETGMRPIEVVSLRAKDIDTDGRTIHPTTAKKGIARILKISIALTETLKHYMKTKRLQPKEYLFNPNAKYYSKNYIQMRNRLAKHLNDQSIKKIRLYDFRHAYATATYRKTRDIMLTGHLLGHKDLSNTQIYVHLQQVLETQDEEYTCKAVDNKEDAMKLIENGFQYVMEVDGYKILRKRK
jgi:integrase